MLPVLPDEVDRVSMRKAKEILRLKHEPGLTNRQIGSSLRINRAFSRKLANSDRQHRATSDSIRQPRSHLEAKNGAAIYANFLSVDLNRGNALNNRGNNPIHYPYSW